VGRHRAYLRALLGKYRPKMAASYLMIVIYGITCLIVAESIQTELTGSSAMICGCHH